MGDDEIQLRGWIDDDGTFKEFLDTRRLTYVTKIAAVLAVYEVRPEVGERQVIRHDPRTPDQARGSVPVLGYAAAGEDVLFDAPLDDGSRVNAPPSGSVGLGAILVRGNSAAPLARDGNVIYIDVSRPFSPTDCVGHIVVARERSGGAYFKTLRRGDDGKRWNLESANHSYETMTNVELEQVFPVRWIGL